MTDSTLSSLRRRARQTGSVEDRAAVLVARLRSAPACDRCGGTGRSRGIQDPAWWAKDGPPGCPSCAGTGSLLRARVELAAYCGDEAAGATLAPAPPLPDWLAGLSRWADVGPVPGWVLVRAAVAAARVALEEMRCDDPHSNSPDWQAPAGHRAATCGSGAAPRRAIEAAEVWLDDPTVCVSEWTRACCRGTNDCVAWLPWPPRSETEDDYAARVRHAARLAGEQPVREAICRSLVEWALSEDA